MLVRTPANPKPAPDVRALLDAAAAQLAATRAKVQAVLTPTNPR